MKYKIIEEVNISGKGKGDLIEAEEHAMELYLKRGQVKKMGEAVKNAVDKLKKKAQ